jgi:lysophospholipase L1-like esterase
MLSAFIIFLVLQILKHRIRTKTNLLNRIFLGIQIVSICGLLFVYCANRYEFDKYPKIDGLFSFFWGKKELSWTLQEIDTKTHFFQSTPPKNGYRIVFIGSSQTWGAGATSENKTFVAISGTLLNTKYQALASRSGALNMPSVTKSRDTTISASIEYINAGVSAVNSTELLSSYKTKWKEQLTPDMLVVNLSNNDEGSPKEFTSNLNEFVRINGTGTKTVFVLEANSAECPPEIAENHKLMTDVGNTLGVPVIDLHNYLLTQNATGILWWDKVHLTDYGHQLAGAYLASNLEKILFDKVLNTNK